MNYFMAALFTAFAILALTQAGYSFKRAARQVFTVQILTVIVLYLIGVV